MKEKVYGYLANQLGFSETGQYVLDTLIKPRIEKIGITINDPFIECAKELNLDFEQTLRLYKERLMYWDEFNHKVMPINNKLMENSDCMLPVLDGGHTVDDGLSSEIGYYAGIKRGPIFALRSDFRLGENISCLINPQIYGYIIQSGGQLITRPNALEKWFHVIKTWHDQFTKEQTR